MALDRKFMCFVILCCEILIICKVGMILAACSYASNQFLTAPQNSIAHEGSWANFTCSPRNFDQDLHTIRWQVAPSTEQRDPIQSADKSGMVISTLAIKVIGRADFSITCSVEKLRSTTDQHPICFSSRAKLTVHYFPDESELKCSPNKPTDVREGELLQVNCNVTRSKPAVDLNWSFDEEGPTLPTLMPDNDGRVRFLTHVLPITQDMHDKTITCVVTSDLAFKGRALNCTIGPIKVLTPPQVTVHRGNITLKDNQHTTLFCEAYGYPDTFTFSWTCSPNEYLFGCNTTSQFASISIRCNHSQTSCGDAKNITVSCTASNYAGKATNASQVLIEREQESKEPDNTQATPKNCERDTFLNMTANYKSLQQQQEATIFCMIPVTNNDSIQVQWYFDRSPLNGHSQRFVLEEFPPSTFSLHIFNLSQSDTGKEVACEIRYCNIIQQSSLLLSFDLNQGLLEEPLDPLETAQQSWPTWWHMVVIASAGVVAAIVLIACIVAMLVRYVKRQLHPNNKGTITTTNHDLPSPDRASVGSNEQSLDDPSYEVPTIPYDVNHKAFPEKYPGEIQRNGLTHTYMYAYDTALVSSVQRSSWTSSSGTSKRSSSTLEGRNEVHPGNNLETEPPYVNDIVVLMHSLRRQNSASMSLKRLKIDVDLNEKEMPTIPQMQHASISGNSDNVSTTHSNCECL